MSERKIAIGVIAGAYFTRVRRLFLPDRDECNDFYACIVRSVDKNQAFKVVCCEFFGEMRKGVLRSAQYGHCDAYVSTRTNPRRLFPTTQSRVGKS